MRQSTKDVRTVAESNHVESLRVPSKYRTRYLRDQPLAERQALQQAPAGLSKTTNGYLNIYDDKQNIWTMGLCCSMS